LRIGCDPILQETRWCFNKSRHQAQMAYCATNGQNMRPMRIDAIVVARCHGWAYAKS
jgi:hypothetical protein